MASTFYELDCGEDESVIMEITKDNELSFIDYDPEADLAAEELGFEPTLCLILWGVANDIKKYVRTLEVRLRFAAADGDIDTAALAIAAGTDVQADDDLALHYASKNGHVAIVELLLDAGADVEARGNYALRLAAQEGHTDVILLLQAYGADLHDLEDEALLFATQKGQANVVELLIREGANIHTGNEAPLYLAAKHGHPDLVLLFLKLGASLHMRKPPDDPLSAARAGGHYEAAALLADESYWTDRYIAFLEGHGADWVEKY